MVVQTPSNQSQSKPFRHLPSPHNLGIFNPYLRRTTSLYFRGGLESEQGSEVIRLGVRREDICARGNHYHGISRYTPNLFVYIRSQIGSECVSSVGPLVQIVLTPERQEGLERL